MHKSKQPKSKPTQRYPIISALPRSKCAWCGKSITSFEEAIKDTHKRNVLLHVGCWPVWNFWHMSAHSY